MRSLGGSPMGPRPPGFHIDRSRSLPQVDRRRAFRCPCGAPRLVAVEEKRGTQADGSKGRVQVQWTGRLELKPNLRLHSEQGYWVSGTLRTKVLPVPAADCTVRSPSCILAISRESHSPSPVPCTCWLVGMRPKRVNRLAWSSLLMPTPWSMTEMAAIPSSRLMRTMMSVPAGEYLAALLSRFLTTIVQGT